VFEINHGGEVVKGIDAPPSVNIARKELLVDDREELMAKWRMQRVRRAINKARGQIVYRKDLGLPVSELQHRLDALEESYQEFVTLFRPIQASNDDLRDLGKRTEVVDV
jgi:hypothetical protein